MNKSLSNFDKLWRLVGLSFTPKVHNLLDHDSKQMHEIGGFSDMLEDDVKLMHQTLGRFEWHLSQLTSNTRKAESHAKMESTMHNKYMQQWQQLTNEMATRIFKRQLEESRADE